MCPEGRLHCPQHEQRARRQCRSSPFQARAERSAASASRGPGSNAAPSAVAPLRVASRARPLRPPLRREREGLPPPAPPAFQRRCRNRVPPLDHLQARATGHGQRAHRQEQRPNIEPAPEETHRRRLRAAPASRTAQAEAFRGDRPTLGGCRNPRRRTISPCPGQDCRGCLMANSGRVRWRVSAAS